MFDPCECGHSHGAHDDEEGCALCDCPGYVRSNSNAGSILTSSSSLSIIASPRSPLHSSRPLESNPLNKLEPSPGLKSQIANLRQKQESFMEAREFWKTVLRVYPNYDR